MAGQKPRRGNLPEAMTAPAARVPSSRFALCALLALAACLFALCHLFRWEVTPLAWDKSEGSRAILLDRWTGRTWLVQKQGLRETFKLTP